LYLFYNASIQGTATMWKAMKSPRVRKVMAGIAVSAFALTELNRLMAGLDKDGENCYDKIQNWEKRRNIIVMNPGGDCQDYFKFPLPYGYNVPHVFGMSISDAIHGDPDDLAKTAINIAVTMVDSFNPLGGGDSENLETIIAKMVSPTFLDPIVDLSTNENFMGSPIMPEQPAWGAQIPDSQRYWNSVSPPTKYIAEKINELTGGTKYEKGGIDISPESLDHWIAYFTGGAGTFMQRMFADFPELAYNKAKFGEEIPVHKVPFVRKFIGERTEYDIPSTFYDQREKVTQIAGAHTKMKKEASTPEHRVAIRKYETKNKEMLHLANQLKSAGKKLKKIREDQEYLKEKEGMDEVVKRDRLKKLQLEKEKIMTTFSKQYNIMKKKKAAR